MGKSTKNMTDKKRIEALEKDFFILRGRIDKTVSNFKKLRKVVFNDSSSGNSISNLDRNALRRIELIEADIDTLHDAMKVHVQGMEEDEQEDDAETAEIEIIKPDKKVGKYDLTNINVSKIGNISKG